MPHIVFLQLQGYPLPLHSSPVQSILLEINPESGLREELDEAFAEKLRMIGEAERYLTHLGFFGVRVRLHGRLARIEVAPKDVSRLFHEDLRETIKRELQNLGFLYVTADLGGYRMGSMNDEIII